MAAIRALRYITIPAVEKHTATVIFAHGLGDTGSGWEPVASMLKADPGLGHVKWVLPHSPTRSVTANMGMEMPAWFDIYSFEFDTEAKEDETGMLASRELLNKLIAAELDAGIDAGRIVLGGFSQGGAMSLLTGLTYDKKLGGVAVLSGWLPIHKKFQSMVSTHAKSIPIFWGHGKDDPLVKYQLGKDSIAYLVKNSGILTAKDDGASGIAFKAYEKMGHSACQKEIDDLGAWLKAVVPKSGTRL